jgi:hypothetical protein
MTWRTVAGKFGERLQLAAAVWPAHYYLEAGRTYDGKTLIRRRRVAAAVCPAHSYLEVVRRHIVAGKHAIRRQVALGV